MKAFLLVTAALLLAGCSVVVATGHARAGSPCDAGETSYACQVERYQNINQ